MIVNYRDMADAAGREMTGGGRYPAIKNTYSYNSYGELSLHKGAGHTFNMIDNYIYFYHLNKFILIPLFPDGVQDAMGISFSSTTPLARSAPIQSFSSAGPRVVTFTLKLHRDMMQDINYNRSNYVLENLGG